MLVPLEIRSSMERSADDLFVAQASKQWGFPGSMVRSGPVFQLRQEEYPVEVVIVGDSHAQSIAPRIEFLNDKYEMPNVGFFTATGCLPLDGFSTKNSRFCGSFMNKFNEWLEGGGSVEKIVFLACFNCYFGPLEGLPANTYMLDGRSFFEVREKALESFFEAVALYAETYEVIVIGDNPKSPLFSPKAIYSPMEERSFIFYKNIMPLQYSATIMIDRWITELDELFRVRLALSGVEYISLVEDLCDGRICEATDEFGMPVYKDGDHLSKQYVERELDVIDSVFLK